tara:strand:- start:1815 stop:2180 length:366 start_codon:yes stop_codon:yes gene_type:complete
MKAYYIDPILQFVAEVDFIPESNLHGFRKIYEWIDAGTFDVVNLNSYGDGMYVDDEGLLKSSNHFFKVPVWNGEEYVQQMYAGKALILGVDSDGDSDDVKGLSFKLLQDRIEFLGEKEIRQ